MSELPDVGLTVRDDHWPIDFPWVKGVLDGLREPVRTALRWTRHLPLDLVLAMPWYEPAGPLDDFHWSRRTFFRPQDKRGIDGDWAESHDLSLWPFRHVRVPLDLVFPTIIVRTRVMDDNDHARMAIVASPHAYPFVEPDGRVRSLTTTDVRDAVADAIAKMNV